MRSEIRAVTAHGHRVACIQSLREAGKGPEGSKQTSLWEVLTLMFPRRQPNSSHPNPTMTPEAGWCVYLLSPGLSSPPPACENSELGGQGARAGLGGRDPPSIQGL